MIPLAILIDISLWFEPLESVNMECNTENSVRNLDTDRFKSIFYINMSDSSTDLVSKEPVELHLDLNH